MIIGNWRRWRVPPSRSGAGRRHGQQIPGFCVRTRDRRRIPGRLLVRKPSSDPFRLRQAQQMVIGMPATPDRSILFSFSASTTR
jgi:hypothetical protein